MFILRLGKLIKITVLLAFGTTLLLTKFSLAGN